MLGLSCLQLEGGCLFEEQVITAKEDLLDQWLVLWLNEWTAVINFIKTQMCFIIRCLKLWLIIVARTVQVVATSLVQFMVILDCFQKSRPKAAADSFTPVKTYACS